MLISGRCVWVTLILAAIPVIPAYGDCAGASFCEKLPQRDDRNSALFVGEVRESSGYRVRFRVVEQFLNAMPGDDFAAQLRSDLYLNGVPAGLPSFNVGTRWLVEATRRSPEASWTTGVCTRTKALESATGDLDILRHWLANQPVPARITGEVFDPKIKRDIPGITLRLMGGNRTLTVVSSAQGQFAFENVVLGMYQLEALLPSGTVTQPVDLIHGWCAYRVIGPSR